MNTQGYKEKIQKFTKKDLINLWKEIIDQKTENWSDGKALEFLILRAFDLEGAKVRWPYTVKVGDEIVEQIDGAVHLLNYNLSILIECKDYSSKINIDPIAKLRNQLLRRSSNAIGAVFTTTKYTEASLLLSQFLAPQTIILWEKDNIEFCLNEGSFSEGMLLKYRHAIEEGITNYDISTSKI